MALPLHPEYRTMPMVWYIPPLSPVVDVVKDTGHDAEDKGNLFAAIDALRIPVEYLANLFTAGDVGPVNGVLRKLAAMRSFMRDINLGGDPDASIAEAVGMDAESMYEMFRLLAIAKYDERYVIPTAHVEQAHGLEELATECPVDFDYEAQTGVFGEGSGDLTPVAVENFRMLEERQTSDQLVGGGSKRSRVNLLNWDGKGKPGGLFPKRKDDAWNPCGAWRARRPRGGSRTSSWPSRGRRSRCCSTTRPRSGRSPTDAIRHAVAGLPDGVRMPLGSFLDHVTSQPLEDVQREYVETFDHTRKCCLYLTYFTFGDTRRRGVALVQFKQAYRKAGLDLTAQELPDHLGVVLEFGATADVDAAWRLLNDHRAGIEMLRLALADRHSPGEQVLAASRGRCPSSTARGSTPSGGSSRRGRPRRRSASRATPLTPA